LDENYKSENMDYLSLTFTDPTVSIEEYILHISHSLILSIVKIYASLKNGRKTMFK